MRHMSRLLARLLAALVVALAAAVPHAARAAEADAPIRLHPRNPRYFEWRGKPLALVTSAEHYGAVVNRDFDYRKYLEALAREGMNYTRVFAGTYIEPVGAFGIERNTLAPAAGRFLAPWARSQTPGYAGGGNKLDLDRFDPEYLARLKDFLTEARRRGVVVELTLFCSTYGEKQWAVHPFNSSNNVQALAVKGWKTLHTLENGPALAYQEKLVRYLARELNGFDNLFYELQNEPWADNHVMGDFINPYMVKDHKFPNAVEVVTAASVAWQSAMARALADEESRLPRKHLIAQNVANFRLPVRDDDLAPGVGVVNFHYAYPEAVAWNAGLGRVIGFDESGFAGAADATYRRQAWTFMMAGGGLFNSLDYSFSVGREDGTDAQPKSPGGGSAALRRQLAALSAFLHSFDLTALAPDGALVRRAPGVVVQALSAPGRAYALYLHGRGPTTLTLSLPRGRWQVEWISVEDGAVRSTQSLTSTGAGAALATPPFERELAARIVRR
jgi:hypothetical protein